MKSFRDRLAILIVIAICAVGAVVALQIRVSRWRCRSLACAVRLFADRLPGVADLRGRRTCRADVVARLIGYALGGRAGERLTARLGLPVSNDTLLRGVKQGAKPTTAARQAQQRRQTAEARGFRHSA